MLFFAPVFVLLVCQCGAVYQGFTADLASYAGYGYHGNAGGYEDEPDVDWAGLGSLLQQYAEIASPSPPNQYALADAQKMLTSFGYSQQQPDGYGLSQPKSGYDQQQQHGGYGPPQHQESGYGHVQSGYEQKPKKVYVPIVIRKKKQKKKKTIAIYKGFYIPGGTQVFGKFKKMSDCQKSCEITPNCFAADYNPWLKKCYVHTNITACEEMKTHPKLIHFKKVPCDLVETPRGLITLGTQIFGGLEQKGIDSLQECIKKCATAGNGIAASQTLLDTQICFGIDYDFATHKCYFHTNSALCPTTATIPTPVQLVAAPSVINILLCPLAVA